MRPTPLVLLVATATALRAQDPMASHAGHAAHHHADSAFDSLQARGTRYMGVDQSASTHRFDTLPDGGRIELLSDRDDSAAVAAIRAHFREIARAFAQGDFTIPGLVHAGTVPGTDVMRARRDAIAYELRDLPRGAELRIHTTDAEARRAIARFMAFQRTEHHAGGEVHR
jgi:hypothetical protein